MSNPHEMIDSYYSLDLLESLDPLRNRDMAQILLGVYIVNARATAQAEELLPQIRFAFDKESDSLQLRKSKLHLLETFHITRNLDKISGLIGNRALRVVDVSDNDGPIRYRGFKAVDQASGVVGLNAYGNRMLHVSGQTDKLRLVQPRRLWHQSDDEYAVKMVRATGDFNPLVEIEVADSLRSFR